MDGLKYAPLILELVALPHAEDPAERAGAAPGV
jgi:hypothetical protein